MQNYCLDAVAQCKAMQLNQDALREKELQGDAVEMGAKSVFQKRQQSSILKIFSSLHKILKVLGVPSSVLHNVPIPERAVLRADQLGIEITNNSQPDGKKSEADSSVQKPSKEIESLRAKLKEADEARQHYFQQCTELRKGANGREDEACTTENAIKVDCRHTQDTFITVAHVEEDLQQEHKAAVEHSAQELELTQALEAAHQQLEKERENARKASENESRWQEQVALAESQVKKFADDAAALKEKTNDLQVRILFLYCNGKMH